MKNCIFVYLYIYELYIVRAEHFSFTDYSTLYLIIASSFKIFSVILEQQSLTK